MGAVERPEQLGGASLPLRVLGEGAEDLARSPVHCLRALVAERPSVDLRDLAREPPPVSADETGDMLAVGPNADFVECAHPRLDALAHRVRECPVQVEDERGYRVDLSARGRCFAALKFVCHADEDANSATSASGSVTGSRQMKDRQTNAAARPSIRVRPWSSGTED